MIICRNKLATRHLKQAKDTHGPSLKDDTVGNNKVLKCIQYMQTTKGGFIGAHGSQCALNPLICYLFNSIKWPLPLYKMTQINMLVHNLCTQLTQDLATPSRCHSNTWNTIMASIPDSVQHLLVKLWGLFLLGRLANLSRARSFSISLVAFPSQSSWGFTARHVLVGGVVVVNLRCCC